MAFTTTQLLVIAILFLSTLTRSALGFGDAVIAMPLLVVILGTQKATPLVAFMGFTIAITILARDWRDVDVKAAWRLILSSLVGIPVGIMFLKGAPEQLVRGILGGVLVLFGLYNLISPQLPKLEWQGFAYIFGLVAGILGGAYNMNGPPIVIYTTLRRWPPGRFRATLQGFFFSSGVLVLTSHAMAGLWTPDVLQSFGYSLPFILLAVYLGGKLHTRIPRARFERFVYIFLLLMGAFLLV